MTFTLTTLFFAGSVVLLWWVSIFARRHGNLAPFMPFFLYAILINVRSAFIYYDVTFTAWWSALEFAVFFSYAWLLFVFVRMIFESISKPEP